MAAVNVTEVLFQHFWLKSRENAKIIEFYDLLE